MTAPFVNPLRCAAAGSVWDRGIFEILFIFIVFFCILFLAYFVTRFVAKRAAGRLKSRYIEVVDSLAVGADAQILIIKAGEELFLAAKSQKQITLLTKLALSPSDVQDAAPQSAGFAENFRSVLEGKLGRALPQGFKTGRDKPEPPKGADESRGNFRGNIGRIKELTERGDERPAAPDDDPERSQGS